jgi:hypothetical protein
VKITREGIIYITAQGEITILGWEVEGTPDELRQEVFRRVLLAGEGIREAVRDAENEAIRLLDKLPVSGKPS